MFVPLVLLSIFGGCQGRKYLNDVSVLDIGILSSPHFFCISAFFVLLFCVLFSISSSISEVLNSSAVMYSLRYVAVDHA